MYKTIQIYKSKNAVYNEQYILKNALINQTL